MFQPLQNAPRQTLVLAMVLVAISAARAAETGKGFEISSFALPNCPPGEIWFEEPRDIVAVEVALEGNAPAGMGLSYRQNTWPGVWLERGRDRTQPCQFGWTRIDDPYNGRWHRAKTHTTILPDGHARIEFEPLNVEYPERRDDTVTFRRTLGLRIEDADLKAVRQIRVCTASAPARSTLRVHLNAGTATPSHSLRLDGYNARVRDVRPGEGSRRDGDVLRWEEKGAVTFDMDVDHMTPAHRYCGDDGHVQFLLDDDAFTISLPSLQAQGPIWFAEKGVFVTFADDKTTPEQYIAHCARRKTIAQRVLEMPEQTYAGAFLGQPRPHSVAWSLGFQQCRQRFWMDANGDLTLEGRTVHQLPAADTKRFANGGGEGNGRFFFGLENWQVLAREPGPAPALSYTLRARKANIEIEQRSLAAPLDARVLDGPLVGDRNLVCLLRFELKNVGLSKQTARLHLEYSSSSGRSPAAYGSNRAREWLVPSSPRESLTLDGNLIRSTWNERSVLRARVETAMTGHQEGAGLTFEKSWRPIRRARCSSRCRS